ncbi:hypothetical protein BWQ96_00357 [Gracilariopsis chorda]|uniref:Uncharacterized protein n=1 Tax=Gracilariopsis chorda TaxID=448386 RepID=A0A2V3J5M1_9FLOR|nr:hypothetical protein BWQ96_00357 [Gracilariopsis chorda]|eukprot:PXF49705.1 hypothetical protein BWQ96_00357 [Gracilariopsis chorda]
MERTPRPRKSGEFGPKISATRRKRNKRWLTSLGRWAYSPALRSKQPIGPTKINGFQGAISAATVQHTASSSRNLAGIVPKPPKSTRPNGHYEVRTGEPKVGKQHTIAERNEGGKATPDALSRVDSSQSDEARNRRDIFAEVIVQDDRDVKPVAGPPTNVVSADPTLGNAAKRGDSPKKPDTVHPEKEELPLAKYGAGNDANPRGITNRIGTAEKELEGNRQPVGSREARDTGPGTNRCYYPGQAPTRD